MPTITRRRATTTSSKKGGGGLPEGKLPIEVLEPLLKSISLIGNVTGNLVVPPSIGVDVGVTKSRGKYLVSSSDPITGAKSRMGWHAVHVSANDVATSGIMPECLSVVSLFPHGTAVNQISSLMEEIGSTAKELGITITGGHTEITPGIGRPIVVVTCFGSGDKFVTASMARAGDSILMTKTAGIEGTSILSRLEKVRKSLDPSVVRRGEELIEKLSIVQEARIAFSTGKVHAMHDSTEGGILGSLVEMSIASKVGFDLESDAVPVDEATERICGVLSIDPLKLIGSGSLIIACPKKDENEVISALSEGRSGNRIQCTAIGRFTPKAGSYALRRRKDGSSSSVGESSVLDELWPTLRKYGNLS